MACLPTTTVSQPTIDGILTALHSNQRFSGFEPSKWLTHTRSTEMREEFMELAFPPLVQYHRGTELGQLVSLEPWLTTFQDPSQHYQGVKEFYKDPVRNIELLNIFVKLSSCSIFGRSMMYDQPLCAITYIVFESYLSSPGYPVSGIGITPRFSMTLGQEDFANDEMMRKEFGDTWKTFTSRCFEGKIPPLLRSIPHSSWLIAQCGTNMGIKVFQQATKTFLSENEAAELDTLSPNMPERICTMWKSLNKKKGSASDVIEYVGESIFSTFLSSCEYTHTKEQWKSLARNVRLFCLAAGCSEVGDRDPFENIQLLRNTITQRFISTAELHRKITEQNNSIIRQQRLITASAYRHVLENLMKGNTGESPTERWKKWFEARVSQYTANPSEMHPLHTFLNKYSTRARAYTNRDITNMVHGLYPMLSRIIHNFRFSETEDLYTVNDGQYDAMQVDFLHAIQPKEWNEDGEIAWDREKARYER